jgi:tetratricopeptide (TPR) repeat protein
MASRKIRSAFFALAVCAVAMSPDRILAQGEGSGMVVNAPLTGGLTSSIAIIDLDLYLKGPNGAPIEDTAVVTLLKMNGQFYKQGTAKGGYLRLNELAQSEYNVLVVAPGYGRVVKPLDAHGKSLMSFTIELPPPAEGEDAAIDKELSSLNPKAQKAVGKAVEALRSNKPALARSQLETAYRIAPTSAEVNYLYGIYSLQQSDRVQAIAYWTKALELYPKHYRALISMSQALLDENRPEQALPYLARAVRAEPSSWRAHAIYADAYLRQGSAEEAVKQAERALELGHGQAALAQRYLAAALARRGERDRAIGVLQDYVQDHPTDLSAKKQLDALQLSASPSVKGVVETSGVDLAPTGAVAEAEALLPASKWLPPDIDEKVPPVEPGAACALDEVVKNAGQKIEELVANVDRFAATESLKHEDINKWGVASSPETRNYDYMVSIHEVKTGFFNVEEFRTVDGAWGKFPDGVQTKGLPALVLIFHPHYVGNFDLTCEGLARWNGGLAWQVHFHQRADKPNTIRTFRLGELGRSFPVALKGRAWIAADTFQILRLETQMVAPVAEIRLFADSTAIEYGPVHFAARHLDLWLPQSAEVYSDWRGRRIHRRHSFSKYLLFSVDDKQQIGAPKDSEQKLPEPSN